MFSVSRRFWWKRMRKDQRGTAMLEFVLCAPFLILLMVGFWNIGMQMTVRSHLSGVLRNGARMIAQATATDLGTNPRSGSQGILRRQEFGNRVANFLREDLQSKGLKNANVSVNMGPNQAILRVEADVPNWLSAFLGSEHFSDHVVREEIVRYDYLSQ